MTVREAIALIKNEIQCVLTQRNCKRDCEHCPLIKPEGDIKEAFEMAIEALQEPPIGHWTDREVFTNDESPIEEWQSCCCSECGRYDTSPYLYFFKAPNYCSWCGAKMEGEEDE